MARIKRHAFPGMYYFVSKQYGWKHLPGPAKDQFEIEMGTTGESFCEGRLCRRKKGGRPSGPNLL